MTLQPTQELRITKTEIYMIILMLTRILDIHYDEIGKISVSDMYDLIEREQVFSFLAKYDETVPIVHIMMCIYTDESLRGKEFSYILANIYSLSSYRHGVYNKGFSLLLEACNELYVHYDSYRAEYNGERTQPYRVPHQVGKFLHFCDKALDPVRKRMKKFINYIDHLLGYC